MVHHLMVRYIVSIRHFLTLHSVNKTLFDATCTMTHLSVTTGSRAIAATARTQSKATDLLKSSVEALFEAQLPCISDTFLPFNGARYIVVYHIMAHH